MARRPRRWRVLLASSIRPLVVLRACSCCPSGCEWRRTALFVGVERAQGSRADPSGGAGRDRSASTDAAHRSYESCSSSSSSRSPSRERCCPWSGERGAPRAADPSRRWRALGVVAVEAAAGFATEQAGVPHRDEPRRRRHPGLARLLRAPPTRARARRCLRGRRARRGPSASPRRRSPASRSSGVTRASSRTRMQSFRSGMRTRLTTKPGVSWQRIGVFPMRSPNAYAVSNASSPSARRERSRRAASAAPG